MDLAADYIHPTPHGGRCRVRIYLPDEEGDAPVAVCSELPDNKGTSVTNAAERIAAEVIKRRGLPVPVWIEQRTAETAHDPQERFAPTLRNEVFSSEVRIAISLSSSLPIRNNHTC
jgi:hypothetical protein